MLGINDLRMRTRNCKGSCSVVVNALDSQLFSNSHDPLDPAAEANFEESLRSRTDALLKGRDDDPQVRVVMGDEIGPVAGGAAINGLETCRKAFHDYLRARLEKMKKTALDYYGVEDVDDLLYLDSLPSRAGLHERRLFYDCARFKFGSLQCIIWLPRGREGFQRFIHTATLPRIHDVSSLYDSSDWFFEPTRSGAYSGANAGPPRRNWGFTG